MDTILVGIDPGIVDTGLVIIRLDPVARTVSVRHRVWTDVSREVDKTFVIDPGFLLRINSDVQTIRESNGTVYTFLEGYRNRGRNIKQDAQMTTLVQTLARSIKGCTVVDNTGVKNVVKPAFMNLFGFDFPTTNHADLESAARIALKGGLVNDEVNLLLSDFVRDALTGNLWREI